jgi:hypothetical protein|uniref:Tail fiber protein n=1 Tax=Myoviridae sp. ctKFg29 TaxID=2827675 RepID=A0A8S5RXI7_9CAUD|nr:MAG TPA: hypothetical protein [Myoviridae sp. ctKFg29]
MITINANLREPIFLRHAGEENALRVAFDLQEFEAHWPGGVPALLVRRPISSMDVAAYPVPLSVDGRTAFWTVSASDTECSGYGKAQLQWRVGGTLAKSCVYDTVCAPSLLAGDAPPDAPSKAWFEAIQGQIGDLSQLTTKAKENLVAAINEAARTGGGSGGGYNIGSGLNLDAETNTLSVDTAEAVEKDNTKPVTSAAVYTEVGNINALLATI